MKKVLIVEDNKKLCIELKTFLCQNGFEAFCLTKFDNTIADILQASADLVLLDIGLPYLDGEYICKEVRKASKVPIIMLTSRESELDELISLNNGADQYVTKPFNIQILLAKITGLIKRSDGSISETSKIDLGEFILNTAQSQIQKGEKYVELTKNEFKIIYFLSKKRGNIVARDEIINYLWDSESFVDDNTLAVNMKRLRDKLSSLGVSNIIETRRGQGYIFK